MFKVSRNKNRHVTVKVPHPVYSTLKGGCTRFEVEHISCNLLLYIGKKLKFFVVENFKAFQVNLNRSPNS